MCPHSATIKANCGGQCQVSQRSSPKPGFFLILLWEVTGVNSLIFMLLDLTSPIIACHRPIDDWFRCIVNCATVILGRKYYNFWQRLVYTLLEMRWLHHVFNLLLIVYWWAVYQTWVKCHLLETICCRSICLFLLMLGKNSQNFSFQLWSASCSSFTQCANLFQNF